MNSPKERLLMLLLLMWTWLMPKWSLSLPRSLCNSMPSRMLHLSISTSTIILMLASSIISLRLPDLASCVQLISSPSTPLTQGNLMEKPCFTWYAIWRRLETLEFVSSLTLRKVLSAIVMLISPGIGTILLLMLTPTWPSPEVGGSYSMQDVLSFGLPSFNPKLPFFDHRGWVHCHVHGSSRYHSNHGSYQGNEGVHQHSSHLHQAICVL